VTNLHAPLERPDGIAFQQPVQVPPLQRLAAGTAACISLEYRKEIPYSKENP
jgi:hypothetical protein